jgi:hypothetical protein
MIDADNIALPIQAGPNRPPSFRPSCRADKMFEAVPDAVGSHPSKEPRA